MDLNRVFTVLAKLKVDVTEVDLGFRLGAGSVYKVTSLSDRIFTYHIDSPERGSVRGNRLTYSTDRGSGYKLTSLETSKRTLTSKPKLLLNFEYRRPAL